MAKHDTDPVLAQLVRAVNESGQARIPLTVTAHGTTVSGMLIAQDAYFKDLAEGNPLLSALQPASGLLARITARRSTPSPAITCTSGPLARTRGCGGSAWSPSTGGRWVTPPPPAQTRTGHSPGYSARRSRQDVRRRCTTLVHRRPPSQVHPAAPNSSAAFV